MMRPVVASSFRVNGSSFLNGTGFATGNGFINGFVNGNPFDDGKLFDYGYGFGKLIIRLSVNVPVLLLVYIVEYIRRK